MKVMYLVTLHRKLGKSSKVTNVNVHSITYIFGNETIEEALVGNTYKWTDNLEDVNLSYKELINQLKILPPSPDYKYYKEGDDIPEIDS